MKTPEKWVYGTRISPNRRSPTIAKVRYQPAVFGVAPIFGISDLNGCDRVSFDSGARLLAVSPGAGSTSRVLMLLAMTETFVLPSTEVTDSPPLW